MSSFSDLFDSRDLVVSFELFPPKSAEGESLLRDHVEQLLTFDPAFLTCTYGAGGSTRRKTLEVCQSIKRETGKPVASHLTLVGSTVDELRHYLKEAEQQGIDYIVALRGDPPKGSSEFVVHEGGLQYANQLVELIHNEFPNFGVLVAGYPEKHAEAPSMADDIENLRRKVDAGADVIVTQLFYSNSDYEKFVELCGQASIEIPIVPGILPVTNLAQIQRLTKMCGAKLPQSLAADLQKHDDRDWQFQVGVDFAIRQVEGLIDMGVPGLHFYVLNKSTATAAVLRAVGAQNSIR